MKAHKETKAPNSEQRLAHKFNQKIIRMSWLIEMMPLINNNLVYDMIEITHLDLLHKLIDPQNYYYTVLFHVAAF